MEHCPAKKLQLVNSRYAWCERIAIGRMDLDAVGKKCLHRSNKRSVLGSVLVGIHGLLGRSSIYYGESFYFVRIQLTVNKLSHRCN